MDQAARGKQVPFRNPFVGVEGGPSGLAILMAAGTALLAKFLLAINTYGTNDVFDWEAFATWARPLGIGMLRGLWQFNHPPSILHFNRFFWWLSGASGIPWPFWFRLPSIVADTCSLWLVWTILGPRRRQPSTAWALLLLAASPVLVMTTGFHGNTDGLMVFFLLLSVLMTERGRSIAAGGAFALAVSVKVMPLITLPALLLSQRGIRQRLSFLASASLVGIAAWSPYLFQEPGSILRRVFGYRSLYGQWGLSFLASMLAPIGLRAQWLNCRWPRAWDHLEGDLARGRDHPLATYGTTPARGRGRASWYPAAASGWLEVAGWRFGRSQ